MVHLEYDDKLLCHTWPGTRHRVQGPAYWVLPRRPKQPGGHDMEVALRPYQDIPYTGNMRGEGMQQGFHGDHLEKHPERDVSFAYYAHYWYDLLRLLLFSSDVLSYKTNDRRAHDMGYVKVPKPLLKIA